MKIKKKDILVWRNIKVMSFVVLTDELIKEMSKKVKNKIITQGMQS
jgi:hypothetical protein